MIQATTRRTVRVAVVTVALALATTVGASADVLTPLEDTGGPGGGGGFGAQLDETARSQDLHALSGGGALAGGYDALLAGSGYESAQAQASAPTVAETRSAQIAGGSPSQDDVLAGSGYEQDDTAFAQTANRRSIELSESKEPPKGVLAGGTAPSARVPLAESEHAQIQQVAANTGGAPQASSPNTTF